MKKKVFIGERQLRNKAVQMSGKVNKYWFVNASNVDVNRENIAVNSRYTYSTYNNRKFDTYRRLSLQKQHCAKQTRLHQYDPANV